MADQHDHSHDSHHHGSHDCSTHEHGDEDDSKWIEIERLYQDKSTEEQSIINWFTEHVKDYCLPTDNPESPDAKFSILSFGCGDGTKDQSALRAIVSSLAPGTKVYYCAVDPDEKSIEKFKKAVKEDSESSTPLLKEVNFDFHVQTYESYVETKASAEESGQRKTSDLILFIDSLCHFSCDLKDALVHCYERELSSNGVIVILLWNGDDFWFKIRKRFSDGTEVGFPDEANDYVTVQDVLRVADENKWRFQMHTPKYNLDVSECFKPDSEQGVKILECLACYSNLQGTAADVSGGGLLEFLHAEAEWKGSARVLNGNLGILVIYK